MPKPSSREQLLDVAEQLFAQEGIDAVSLRQINAQAGLSPAALHYHFKNKTGLVQAILERRVMPRHEFEALIKGLQEKHPPSAWDVAHALVMPAAGIVERDGNGGQRYVQLVARLYLEQHSILNQVLLEVFQNNTRRIFEQLRRAQPELPEAILRQRHALAVFTSLQGVANLHKLTQVSQLEGPAPAYDFHQSLHELINWISAGLSAPV